HCVEQHINHALDTTTASMAKYWITDLQNSIVDRCLQLFGGYGYMDEYPISRMYRDARVQRIYAGTNEIMKRVTARILSPLRGEPPWPTLSSMITCAPRAGAARRTAPCTKSPRSASLPRCSARCATATSSTPGWSTTWFSAASIRWARRVA